MVFVHDLGDRPENKRMFILFTWFIFNLQKEKNCIQYYIPKHTYVTEDKQNRMGEVSPCGSKRDERYDSTGLLTDK